MSAPPRDSRAWIRSTALLAGSNIAAQAILLAGSLAVVFLFTPEEVGTAAAFVSVVGLVSIVAALRYDLALPLVDSEARARDLLLACLVLVAVTSIVAGAAAMIWAPAFVRALGAPAGLSQLRLVVLPAVFLTGLVTVFTQWATREQAYGLIARTKVAQASGQVVTQLALGVAGFGAVGLALGSLAGGGGGSFLMARGPFEALRRGDGRGVDRRALWALLTRYRGLPTLSVVSALCQGAATALLPLVVGVLYDVRVAGLVVLAQRVLAAPSRIVGEAASRTYFGDAAALHRSGASPLRARFRQAAVVSGAVASVPAVAVAIAGPLLFGLLGPVWGPAGAFARPLALLLVAQLVIQTVNQTFVVLERLGLQAVLAAMRVVLAIGAAMAAHAADRSALGAVTAYSVAGFLGHAISVVILDGSMAPKKPPH